MAPRLVCLSAWPVERGGTIKRCGLVRVGEALLEEVGHCGGRL